MKKIRQPGSKPQLMSKRQEKLLRNGLERLGFASYLDYLESQQWKEKKEQYRETARPEPGYWKRGLPQTCIVCRDPNVDLHHRTYQRLGEEKLTDLVPLCRHHHDQLHEERLDFWRGPTILHRRERERRRGIGANAA